MAKPWIDITLPIRPEYPSWPGDPRIELKWYHIQGVDGADSNVTTMASTVHFGTHLDAPRHFLPGAETVECLSFELLMGEVYVLDVSAHGGHITGEDIDRVPEGCERLLVRTANSELGYLGDTVFHTDYRGLLPEAARKLVARGIRLVGVDYYSIGAIDHNPEVHTTFLSQKGAVALEGIVLKNIREGSYEMVCLPLLLEGREGAPCRVLLREKE